MSKKKDKPDLDYVPKSPKEVKELVKSLSMKVRGRKQFRNTADKLRDMEER